LFKDGFILIPGLKKVMMVSGDFSMKTRTSFKISHEQTPMIINFGKGVS